MKKPSNDLRKSVEQALDELEKLSDEIRVKIHLAGMDARQTWDKDLEPRLDEARQHARDAKVASKKAIDDTVRAFRSFASQLT